MEVREAATEDDLRQMPRDGRKYELVDGEIRVSPAGGRHGQVIVRLTVRLDHFVTERGLGVVLESGTGYRLPGGNIRSPDVSFVAAERLPGGKVPEDFLDLTPDLAVEVLSPEDRPREILDKVGEYLAAGSRLVWVIDPRQKRAAAYRSPTELREIGPGDALVGEPVLPGFTCPLAELLA